MIKKVLIVDDNSTNLYMLETLLKEYGFEVTSAENGKDALDKARLNPPDLIVTDILMPVMDGYALCREWKADDTLQHIPFVFYTATYTGSKNEEFALSLGADRFILKPQEPDILVNLLKEVLEENYAVRQVATKPLEEEMEFFRQYNEILFNKLEKKMSDLEIANKQLRILEEHYRLSFENVGDVIYTIDNDLHVLTVSPSVERILGYKPQDFIGRPVSDLGHILTPESFEQIVANISSILNGDTIPSTIYRFIAKDGAIKYGEVSGSPIMREGKIIGIVSVARDITQRKQAEEALLSEKQLSDSTINSLPGIFYLFDDQGGFKKWNNNFEKVSKYSAEELSRMHPLNFFTGEDRQLVEQAIQRVFTKGEDTIEAKFVSKDGRRTPYLLTGVRITIGNTKHLIGMGIDITERKQAEEALTKSEKKYRDLYNFLPIPVYEMDLEANITSANLAIYKTFRGTEEDLKKGFKAWQLLSPEDIDKSAKNIQRLLKGEQIGGTEYTLMRLDGSVFPAIIISSVIYSNDKPVGLRGAIVDITVRRQQEEELSRTNAFLDSIVENIPDMIFLKNARDLRFVRFNQAGEDLLGYSRADLLGKNDYDLFPKEQADFFIEKDRKVLHEKKLVDIPEELIQTGNKGERTLHTKKVPILNAKGEPEYLLGISEDITNRKQAEESLKESEKKYRNIIDNAMEGIYQTSPQGRFITVNPAYVQILGYESAEELIESVTDIAKQLYVDPSKRAELIHLITEHDFVSDFQLQLYRKDRSIIWVSATTRAVKDEGGNLLFMEGMVLDITERKRVEEALKESAEKYQRFFMTSRDCVFITSKEGRWIDMNDAAVELFGYSSREELMQVNISNLYANPEERTKHNSAIAERGYSTEFSVDLCRKNGTVMQTLITSVALHDAENNVIGFQGTIRDITERKRAEEALKQSEKRYHSIFDNAQEGIFRSTPEGRMILANQAMANILGYDSPEEVIAGMTDIVRQLYVHPEERTKILAIIEEQGFVRNYETQLYRKDGSIFWVSMTIHAVRDKKGQILYYEGMDEDITTRKENVERIRKTLGSIIQAMAVTVETRDPYTAGHQRRVTDLSRAIATEMNLPTNQIDGIRMAAIIHDLGKISVPAEILSKPSKLTDLEFGIIKTHAQSGYNILKDIDFPWPIARMVLEHHERIDGSGYPKGLVAEETLLESRILSVADVVEAMASHRPYRPGLGLDAALQEIEKNKGTFYDTDAVDACLKLFREKGFQFERT